MPKFTGVIAVKQM